MEPSILQDHRNYSDDVENLTAEKAILIELSNRAVSNLFAKFHDPNSKNARAFITDPLKHPKSFNGWGS